jgi:hypothetical protein
VRLLRKEPFCTTVFSTFSYPNYRDYRERQTVFGDVAATRAGVPFGLGVDGNASSASGAYVSANFFSVLGVRIAQGRGFLPEEESPANSRAVVVVSDRVWRSQLRGDREAIGRSITLTVAPSRWLASLPPNSPATIAGEPRPRADASICDRKLLTRPGELTAWLQAAIRTGKVSELFEGEFPRYAWHRDGDIVYEARLINSVAGQYKGYPLNADEWPSGL